MSRKGDCYDNTVAESFFHTLKNDQFRDRIYSTRLEARQAVIDYIEMFYNSHRLYSYLGYVSPADIEMNFVLKKIA
jgi:putative transposase